MKLQPARIFLYMMALVWLSYACKTARQARTTSQPQKTMALEDSIIADSTRLLAPMVESEPADSLVITDTLALVVDTSKVGVAYEKDTLLIIGVGDIMLGTNYPKASYLPPRSWNPLDSISHILKDADITFGNLEGVILDDGGDPKECKNPDACYLFRSPEYMADYIKDAGFDVMSLANNHAGDFGETGRQNTMRILDSMGIYYAGLTRKPFAMFDREGLRFGFAAFAPNTGTVNINDIDGAVAITAYLDSICDIVIISFHGGAEGADHQNVTREIEYYYGETRGNVYEFSHAVIDAGADVVFGHGPHVSRSIEIYNERLIAYSLGNFCTWARFNLRGPNGIAPLLKIYTDKTGRFLHGKIVPVKQMHLGIPVLDRQRAAIFKIQELTHMDFPEMKINIDDLGNINYLDFDF